jgi:hypothetical protein
MNRIAFIAALALLAALGLALVGCAKDQNKQVDPHAFSLWIMPW